MGPPGATRLRARAGALVAAVLLPLVGCAPADGDDAAEHFAEWTRDLVTSLEPPLDEPSGDAADAELAFTREWLLELRAIPPDRLGPEERLDWRFAESLLSGREIALADRRRWARDPARHLPLGELEIALAAGEAGEPAALDALLESLPDRLDHGRRELEVHVPRLRERALRESERVAALLSGTDRPGAGRARDAVEGWRRFLRETLVQLPRSHGALGSEAYARLLRDQHLLEPDALAIWRRAERGLRESAGELEPLAARMAPGADWRELVRREVPPPTAEEWRAAIGEAWRRVEGEVGTAPAEPPALLPARRLAGSRCGLRGALQSAAAGSRVWVFDAGSPRLAGELAAAAAHQIWPGHHLQRLRQSRHPRPLRRRFGSRLFDEGWALYAEQRLLESGPAPEVRLRLWALRAQRAARLAADVGLHTGRLDAAEAAELLTGVGLPPDEARDEADAILARPGRSLGLLGLDALLALRADARRRDGPDFDLRAFHDRVLGAGSLPPALLREAVLSRGPRRAHDP